MEICSRNNFTISSLKANLIAIPLSLVIIFLFVFAYIIIWNGFPIKEIVYSPFMKLQFFLPAFTVLAFLHEIIHWLSFRIFGKVDSKKCHLGFQWKTITPFAHCSAPMKANVYRVSLILPALLLGITPSIVAIIFGLSWLLVYGIVFTITGGGDFIILWLIRKVGRDKLLQDHPTKCGCIIIFS